ncbi:autotransporter outer membrane beta-barrel domain-containing protein [Chania multitudinisentens]|uniref:autotransporter outer membrane beta-barrel domain-containing protein n=1 Tax=Chania multitudinisentens TaxID=1639108 RepID=UPI0003E1420A|nr:autotransporter outer membrane beta-barrel domain-containing protein [Chania multitudinisentens]
MNKVYRLVRHHRTGSLVPVSELSRSGGKSPQNRKVGIAPGLLLAVAGMFGSAGDASAAEILIDGGTEETVPGTKPDGWKTGIRVDLVVGDISSGKLTIGEGAKATTVGAGYLARQAGSVGEASISGANSRWTLYNYDPLYGQDLKIGVGGEGKVSVLDAGTLDVSFIELGVEEGSKGTLNITGANSQLLGHQVIVGKQGIGEFNISDSGKFVLDTFDKVIVGYDATGQGTINVDGAGSQLYYNKYGSSSMYVGYGGQGVMNVSNGAKAGAAEIHLGTLTGAYGELNISGVGSVVSSPSGVVIRAGEKGEGKVSITDGAVFDGGNYRNYLGDGAGGKGTLLVSGTGSVWKSSVLTVGNGGEGQLQVVDGGRLEVAGLAIASQVKSQGSAVVSGATSSMKVTELNVGVDGVGSLTIANGAQVMSTGADKYSGVSIGERVFYSGTAPASGSILVKDQGTLFSAGYINIGGTNGDGTLTIADGALVKVSSTGQVRVGDSPVSGGGSLKQAVLNIGTGGKAGILETSNVFLHSRGILNFNYTDNQDFSPKLSGTGTINHLGSGTTRLMSKDNILSGTVNVVAGTLQAGVANSFGANLFSPAVFNVAKAGTLDLAGFNAYFSGLSNAGVVNLGGNGSAGMTLALSSATFFGGGDGSYKGEGGTLRLNTVLGGDDSVTDRLVITGSSSGQSWLQVNNVGGQGAKTVEGIEVISVTKESNGVFNLQKPVVAGAYEYLLHKGGKQDPANGNWYLRSEAVKTPEPPKPEIPKPGVPEVETPDPEAPAPGTTDPQTPPPGNSPSLLRVDAAAYLNNQNAAVHMFDHTRSDRMGEPGLGARGKEGNGAVWIRAHRNNLDAGVVGKQLSVETDLDVMQIGGELQHAVGESRLHTGIMLGYGNADTQATSDLSQRNAKGKVTGTSFGVYGTWYQNASSPTGVYLDSWLQYGRYDNEVQGSGLAREEYQSNTWSGSLELGYALPLYEGSHRSLYLEPQGQVIFTRYSGDAHTEDNGTRIAEQRKNQTTTRLGVRLFSNPVGPNANQIQPFLQLNWWSGGNDATVEMNETKVRHKLADNVYEAKAGVQFALGKGWSASGNIGVQGGNNDFRDVNGQLGLRYSF